MLTSQIAGTVDRTKSMSTLRSRLLRKFQHSQQRTLAVVIVAAENCRRHQVFSLISSQESMLSAVSTLTPASLSILSILLLVHVEAKVAHVEQDVAYSITVNL
jgi:hypothetical protein